MAGLNEIWIRERNSITIANEAQTEDRLIQPILDLLGFERQVQPQSRLSSGRRIPDYALFTSLEDRQSAESAQGLARFERAVALAEAKRFDVALDKRGAGAGPQEDPEAQVLDYMWRTRVKWAILTNGKEWRLYGQAGDLVEAAHLSIPDLPSLVESGDLAQLRYFLAFFGSDAFKRDASGTCFLDRAFTESEANARRIGDSLRDQMFAAVPKIATGLIGNDLPTEENLKAAFTNSLVILYRLLFCLYAESRELLPVENPSYATYGLRSHRENLVESSDGSMRSNRLFNDLEILFNLVNEGDEDLGINQYNGGLFSEDRHPWLAGRSVPDPLMRDALLALYTVDDEQIDYRDLSIRHLGTMYEQLLERQLAVDDGEITLVAAAGRHESGSYFTPEPIVDAIVERTLDPLLGEISERVRASGLTGDGAREEFLKLTVCDPAMGSGHFLVSAATYISRFIATDPSQENFEIDELAIRRKVTERCLYGVDLNSMAVELARLALWLITVDGSRPLTFLVNLRAGNSLVGSDIDDLRVDILFEQRLATGMDELFEIGGAIRATPSNHAEEVHGKALLEERAKALRNELEGFADEAIQRFFTEGVDLPFHWEIEFPEVFLNPDGTPNPTSGFDAMVGNPPYVRIQELGREFAQYFRGRFATAHGSFDLYIVFVERSFGLLKQSGRLGFIVPNKFLKLDAGSKLRSLLASGRLVDEVIDFGDTQIFEGATNYTCILGLSPRPSDEVDYIRVDDREHLPLPADIDRAPIERFDSGELGEDPWILVPSRERSVMRATSVGTVCLSEVTQQIFQGLITSADPIYIVEDRGPGPNGRRIYSRESGTEHELEPDLLHRLASGKDIDRWAVRPLGDLLIFPYKRVGETMRLLNQSELAALPLTATYLEQHEARLRSRESGAMDNDRWYAFGRTQSLGLHSLPKLGVAATVKNLEVAPDPNGSIYFHNVRVNGILPDDRTLPLWPLLAILNSRVVDFTFRRIAAEHANGYYAANKQFIAPLPIMVPDSDQGNELGRLAESLHASTSSRNTEKHEFLRWLKGMVGRPLDDLTGYTGLNEYEQLGVDGILNILRRNRRRLEIDPDSRSVGASVRSEYDSSLEKLGGLNRAIASVESNLEDAVYDLYEISNTQRDTIDAEYDD